ncbi:uncharacterized protein ARB_02749 [Trichophyton benhamiae CBS 112371]|uniref:Uncharacterized protein n=1 Tax=Arthroderma benhamiae (strain ATCC MYA-4681 / CBS 112371) TaxID=663331 RepID=D4B2R6_ARTBC|nr:uncharacterized protein ARB_02749 [Trichophyton benhamiae CBS 112371]EFE30377.1 hypothetical protein ARB_02749 [Trichophyton benhamiae CBS 112371]
MNMLSGFSSHIVTSWSLSGAKVSICISAIEESTFLIWLGNLPYPKLQAYVQSLLDTKNLGDLEDLVDGMDLSEEWGEQNLSLEGHADSNWSTKCIEALRADGTEELFIFVDPRPTPQREIWQNCVRNKQRRMGWKYPPEIYATRFRRHGSKDPLKGMEIERIILQLNGVHFPCLSIYAKDK